MIIKKAVYDYGFALKEQYVDKNLPEIAIAGKEVIDRIRAEVGNIPISAKHHSIDIVLSKFYDKAPLLGSAAYVFENLYFC